MFNFDLTNKVAIVTGGNTGLGAAYAKALAANGADIVVAGFDPEHSEIKAEVEGLGKKFLFVQANLTKDEDIDKLISETTTAFGKIDILVNNAGTIKRAPLLDHSLEDWNMVIDINLNAVFKLSQKVARLMKDQGHGKIINIASMLSFQGGKFVPGYTASKHGVAGITKSFANELAEFNVQTNAVAPGYIKTENTAPIRADEKRNAEILSRIPANRWADPDDIAGAVVFLASSASDYVNGVTIPVDGGWLAR